MKKRLSINLKQHMFNQITKIKTKSLIVGVYEGSIFNEYTKNIDIATDGALKKLKKLGELEGKLSQCCYLPVLPGIKAERVYLVGCGKKGRKLSTCFVINFCRNFIHSSFLFSSISFF